MLRNLLFAGLFCWVALVGQLPSAHADIMNVNVDGVDPRYRSAFLQAEAFWESRIIGYSPILPASVRNRLSKLQITAVTTAIDGVGGVLGSAGPTNVLRFGGTGAGFKNNRGTPIAIATAAQMNFDTADIADLASNGGLLDVIKHEMGHALGFGSLWRDNGLIATINGQTQYIGSAALAKYRTESGNRGARWVPVEQTGGAGTAGSHWDDDDPFFNRRTRNGSSELMIGNIDPGNETKFTSETTWAAMADLWYQVKGINDNLGRPRGGPGGYTKWTGGPPLFLTSSGGPNAVPEPGSIGVLLAIGACGALVRGRRKS
jgi:hypothetical protein